MKTLKLLPVTLTVFLFVSLETVLSQSTPNATKSPTPKTSTTEPASAVTTLKTTTSTAAATTKNVESTTTTSLPPSPSSMVPEGFYDSPCNTTADCQPDRSLRCLTGVCICPEPEIFDVREQRCIVPLGKQCLESVLEDDVSNCPEFAECFMDRCVCKTGYSMHTMTRCKSDYLDGGEQIAETNTKAQLWPKQALPQELSDKAGCTPGTCDESKGLQCQAGGACKCKDPEEIYIDEFGRCLSSNMQKSLKDALSLVTSSEDDIKSFVKLLEKFEDGDQEGGASDNYHRPIHHILDLLGDDSSKSDDDTHSQVAPSRSYYDHMTAAQEPAAESTLPSDTNSGHNGHSPSQQSRAPRQDPIPTEQDMGQPLPYGMESQESTREPYHPENHHYLPLDTYQSQGQEPQIVQRQAPAYGDTHHRHGEGIPLHGYGVIPESTNHFPLGHGRGYGHGGYGGGYPGHGFHGGHHGGHHQPLGGHHGSHGGFGGPAHHPPPPPPPKPKPKQSTILIEMAELLGRSFKLVDRFLPLIYVINDALKKEGLLGKIKDKDDGHREHRDVSKEKTEVLKEGAMLASFAKFMGLLLRLKKRLEVLGGADALKKILT